MRKNYFEQYGLREQSDIPGERVKANTAAVMARIASEEGVKPARVSRISRAPLAAAAAVFTALTVGTVSVGAYYQWDFDEVLKSWFGSKDKLHSVISEATADKVNSTFENLDIKVGGALKSDKLNIIFLDIERTDGMIFDMSEYEMTANDGTPAAESVFTAPLAEFEQVCLTHVKEQAYYGLTDIKRENVFTNKPIYGVKTFYISDDTPRDNKITLGLAWTDDDTSSGSTLELSLSGFRIMKQYYNDSYGIYQKYTEQQITGRYTAEITVAEIGSDIREATLTEPVPIRLESALDEQPRTDDISRVTELKVCPMAVSMKIEMTNLIYTQDWQYRWDYDGRITMRDGSVVNFGRFDPDRPYFMQSDNIVSMYDINTLEKVFPTDGTVRTLYFNIILPEAIDVGEVETITINGSVIPF